MTMKGDELAIFRKMLTVTDGRDKTLKCIQYFCKLLVWAFLNRPGNKTSNRLLLRDSLKPLITQLSTTRKVIRLGHVLEPISELSDILRAFKSYQLNEKDAGSKRNPLLTLAFVHTLLSISNDVLDDIYCLGRVGVFRKEVRDWADIWANRAWFTGTLFDLRLNFHSQAKLAAKVEAKRQILMEQKVSDEEYSKQMGALQNELFWVRMSGYKLLCDCGFSAYDVFHWKFTEGYQHSLGFMSGVLSFSKIFAKTTKAVRAQ
ncbi:hypothetical protein SAICODRAFT_19474 [Saitoella complicata NRRL Y-17804]|nr:uncharacterized protein SAICODRAFT_19474 [Saitoella complicata NRRL Y-17804]ODQ52674.1 hypothetical protein SAICODRAFT_19474 [Saitoella complicata NRRL Y-17804]